MSAPPAPPATFSLEDRPDYMLEAFLDEQSLLVKPLLLRRLSLLTLLDLQAQIIERQTQSPPVKKPRLPEPSDRSLAELLELSDEKIQVAKQLQDIAFKQIETLLEVQAALEAGVKREREENPPRPTSSARATGSKATQSALPTPSPVDEEVWCICRRPDDGRPMVACDNPKCPLTWWHVDCVERHIFARGVGAMPDENASWVCPSCTEKASTAQSPNIVRKRLKQEYSRIEFRRPHVSCVSV